MINIVRNLDNANFVTHAGKFHADEIFATILLEEIYGEINLIRLPEVDGLNLDNKFVYDIGGGEFDHHQIGGNGQRNSGIKYAAFGLVWKAFGRKFLVQKNANNIEDCFYMFDKNFVQFIDAGDNGQIKYENIDIKLVTLSDVIEGFNPNWNEDIDSDEKFKEALQIAKKIFNNKIHVLDNAEQSYGMVDGKITQIIEEIAFADGIFLDPIYNAKAFCGMISFLEENKNYQNVLFLNTGGSPNLFADW